MYAPLPLMGMPGRNIYSDKNWKENKDFLYFRKNSEKIHVKFHFAC